MSKIQTISVDFAKQNMNRMNLMCKFVEYKHKFSSVIYNYSPKKAHELNRVPWSERTIDRHIKDFLRLGWVKKDGTKIVFLSKKELQRLANKKKRSFYYKINCRLDYKEIRTHLYAAILKRKLIQMKFRKDNPKCLQDRKKLLQTSSDREGLKLSLEKISALFWYKSISSAKKRVKEVVDRGLLKNKRFRPKLIYCFRLGGLRFKNPCTVYYLPAI